MKVTVWHRQDLSGRHEPDVPITAVYDYDREIASHPSADDMHALAEQAFRMFNGHPATGWEQAHTDRYYAAGNRSLSVGDVVVIGEVALSCEPVGWSFVTLPAQDRG